MSVLLASGGFPSGRGWLFQGLVLASWWEGLVPVLWWGVLNLFPLMGRDTSGAVFGDFRELRTTLGSLSADGWGCVPFLLLVWY